MTFFATCISIARSSYLVYTFGYFEERKILQKKWTQTHSGFILAGPCYLNVWTFGFVVSILFIYLFDIFWIEDPRTDVLYAFLAVYESTCRCWTSFLYPKKRPSMKRSSEVTTYLYYLLLVWVELATGPCLDPALSLWDLTFDIMLHSTTALDCLNSWPRWHLTLPYSWLRVLMKYKSERIPAYGQHMYNYSSNTDGKYLKLTQFNRQNHRLSLHLHVLYIRENMP